MIDYNIKTMTNVIKYENFTEWKKEKTYKAKSLTCDICIKYISNVYVDYVINYSFNNFSQEEKRLFIEKVLENNNEVHYFYKKSYSNADTLFKYLREAGYFEDKNFLLFILEKCIENNIKIFADYIITRYMREKLTFEDFKPMIEKEDFFNTISFSSFFTYYKHLISNDFCIKFPKNLNDAFNKNSYSSEKEVNYKITAAGFEKLIDNNDIEALTIKNILAYNKYVKKELTKVSKDYSKKILVKAFNKIFNFNSFCEDIICFNGNKTKETTGLLDIIKELTFSFNITV